MNILGIETSCDETSVAVVRDGCQILSNVIYSQAVHEIYGGVVPELASREHIKRIVPIMNEALSRAGMTLSEIDGFAATYGPGLVGALLVGLSFGKSLAYCSHKPFCAVNHLEGHIVANLLAFPEIGEDFIALLVSGGHTMLVDVNGIGHYQILGKTLDDAVGEAFDKVGKLLGLGYPGGAAIDKLAAKGDPTYFRFPRAIPDSRRLDFSYSGLKTAVALHLQKLTQSEIKKRTADIAASFQEAAVDMLCDKSMAALKKTGKKTLTLSGGVAANSRLRSKLTKATATSGVRLIFPDSELCTDNAAMIAATGFIYLSRGDISPFDVNAIPNLNLTCNQYFLKKY